MNQKIGYGQTPFQALDTLNPPSLVHTQQGMFPFCHQVVIDLKNENEDLLRIYCYLN